MQAPQQKSRPPVMILLPALAVFLVLVVAEWLAILLLNDGHFMFVLDDPYIHLSLAENIRHGHYGVNAAEYAAPSSSILWPFLLAPFAESAYADLVLLLLNTGFGLLVLLAVWQRLPLLGLSSRQLALVLILFLLATNLAGLVFIGMEHSLQVWLAVLLACGMVDRLEGRPVATWLLFAIIVAPLVRYENALVSAVALVFLFWQREYVKSIGAAIAMVVGLAAFSGFLMSLGLAYLPDSVLAKSAVAAAGPGQLLGNLGQNLAMPNTPKAIAMLLLSAYLLAAASVTPMAKPLRYTALLVAGALLLHLLGGRIGWYFRYEMAMWGFALVLFAYLQARLVQQPAVLLLARAGKWLTGVVAGVALLESAAVAVTTPLAAANVYHQQYQLHRFVTGFYHRPVAVNDLGWTSYRNGVYVLDLWGLGSSRAREMRKGSTSVRWMDELAAEKNVGLIMIYHNPTWFAEVPANWVKVAELDVAGPKITAWYPVSFYVRDGRDADLLRQQLQAFSRLLPEGSLIRFSR